MLLRSISRLLWPLVGLAVCALLTGAMGSTGWISSVAQAQSSDDQQKKTPLPLKPNVPGVQVNHRLILKDGTYQVVRKYEIVGDRVRYVSVERGGDWEELPYSLIDWVATRKWEQQAEQAAVDAQSPAMQEAEEIDKEEAAERLSQKDRMPEVARGLKREMARRRRKEHEPDHVRAGIQRDVERLARGQAANLDDQGHGFKGNG